MLSLTSKLVLTSSLAVMGVAAPITFSPRTVVTPTDACAESSLDGTCCPGDAICGLNGVNYGGFYFSSGKCEPQ